MINVFNTSVHGQISTDLDALGNITRLSINFDSPTSSPPFIAELQYTISNDTQKNILFDLYDISPSLKADLLRQLNATFLVIHTLQFPDGAMWSRVKLASDGIPAAVSLNAKNNTHIKAGARAYICTFQNGCVEQEVPPAAYFGPFTASAADFQTLTLSCQDTTSYATDVSSVKWVCANGGQSSAAVNANLANMVRTQCINKYDGVEDADPTCKVQVASPEWFGVAGDPCSGVVKVATVVYSCLGGGDCKTGYLGAGYWKNCPYLTKSWWAAFWGSSPDICAPPQWHATTTCQLHFASDRT